ncbi:YSIRK-type signal peptide-containing protein, partial [Streptococcus uberis]
METKEIYSFRKFKTGTHSALIGKFGIALTT